MEYVRYFLTLFPTAYFFRGSHREGGWNPPPPKENPLISVRAQFVFVHSNLYIYKQLKSKRTSFYLQNFRDEVRSKFGR
jgi:hypothetical protein